MLPRVHTHIGGQDRKVYNSIDKHLLSMGSFFRFSRRIAILSLRITLPPKLTARKERYGQLTIQLHSKCIMILRKREEKERGREREGGREVKKA